MEQLANAQFMRAQDQTKIISEEFSFETHFLQLCMIHLKLAFTVLIQMSL